MSLNLGTPACEAAKSLRGNADWQIVRDGIHEQVRARMNLALDGDPGNAQKLAGYAQALRDLWVALESATLSQHQNQVKKPNPAEKK